MGRYSMPGSKDMRTYLGGKKGFLYDKMPVSSDNLNFPSFRNRIPKIYSSVCDFLLRSLFTNAPRRVWLLD